jgi:hypothetical protein
MTVSQPRTSILRWSGPAKDKAPVVLLRHAAQLMR